MSAGLDELEALYRARFNDFLRVATALTGSVESGREAVHDGFVNAVRSRHTFQGRGTLDGWVWKAVANSALSAQRRQRRRRKSESNDAGERLQAPAADQGRADVRAIVSTLPERQRLVLFLRYYADLDYASIATVAGIRPGTVGATLHAAQEALRERLQEVSVS